MKHTACCYFVILFLILVFSLVGYSARPRVPIGGIFHDGNHETEIAFRAAMRRLNKHNPFFELVPVSHFISNSDSFRTWKAVCNLTEYGVAAIVGPFSRLTSFVSGSIGDYTGIPNIQGHWDHNAMVYNMTVNIYPDPNTLSEALVDVFEWDSYVIIYDTVDAVVRLHSLLQKHTAEDPPITLRQLSPDGDYRPLFKELRDHSVQKIVLDCEPELIMEVLRQAKLLGMLGDYHSYLLISLDSHTLDFSPLRYDLTNVTSLRLVNTGSYQVDQAVNDFLKSSRKPHERIPNVTPDTLKTETALVYDAVTLLHEALLTFYHSVTEDKFIPQIFKCNELKKKPTQLNQDFLNIIKSTVVEDGLTGPVELDSRGRRTVFDLELTELNNAKFQTIALYNSNSNELDVKLTDEERESQIAVNIKNKTFKVVSRLGPPYLMPAKSKDGKPLVGNDQWEGYSKDLIELIANSLQFKFEFYLVKDNKYGSYNMRNKRWNGLLGDLITGKADLGICDLTITSERIEVVDFTMPFMSFGISILFEKNVKKSPRLFTFMDPFNRNVWIYTVTAYFGMSLLIYILVRFSPEERKPVKDKPEQYQYKWTLMNCLWVCGRCLLSAGCDMFPRSRSISIIMVMWWFFALVMNNTYKANMAAFLTRSKMGVEIKNVYDLAGQTKIKYGVVEGGSTAEFFRSTKEPTYRKMWGTMSQQKSGFMESNENGVHRILKSNHKYAFIMESTSLEYLLYRNCRLKQVGELLNKKSYGIALPKNSPYRTLISAELSQLKEKGKLKELKVKWWETENEGEGCEGVIIPEEDFKQLENEHVQGVYIVLGFGIALAIIITLAEFLWYARKVYIRKKVPISVTLKNETMFALKFWLNKKPTNITIARINDAKNRKEINLTAKKQNGRQEEL